MFDEREPERIELSAELAALERQLTAMNPAAPRIDRDRLMFEAGRAAALAGSEPSPNPSLQGRGATLAASLRVAGARNWFWPAATAAMTAATVVLATMLVWQRHSWQVASVKDNSSTAPTQIAQQSAAVAEETLPNADFRTASWPPFAEPSSGYLGVRNVALTRGLGALPTEFRARGGDRSQRSRTKPATARELLDEMAPKSASALSSRS
jgi:hypothetical protein